MGEVNYKPLIDDMVWSFSRADSYGSCPHRWYLRYIRRCKEKDKFYASYGTFMHKLIEQYYNGELTKAEMLTTFLRDFKKEVRGFRPKEGTLKKFIDGAVAYLTNFEPFPYKMVAVEKKVEFEIEGIKFVGYIDFLGQDESDGEFVVIDNKSRDLKPRSTRAKPTVKDRELDEILRQLYIYCIAVEQEYGKLPKALCINCFRTGTFITEPFNKEAYEEAKKWVVERVEEIRQDEDFDPKPDLFQCFWICGVSDNCEHNASPWKGRAR